VRAGLIARAQLFVPSLSGSQASPKHHTRQHKQDKHARSSLSNNYIAFGQSQLLTIKVQEGSAVAAFLHRKPTRLRYPLDMRMQPSTSHIAQRIGDYRSSDFVCNVLVCKAWADWLAEDLVLAATSLVFQDYIHKPRMPHRSGSLSIQTPLWTTTNRPELYNIRADLPIVDHRANLISTLCWSLVNCFVVYFIYFLFFNLSSSSST
jgi:hypothetical protein